MSMMNIFNVAGSAVSAQSQRLNVVASNLANVDTVAGPDGKAYKARQVTFQTTLLGANHATGTVDTAAGVRVSTVSEDQSPGRRVHDPKHPSADGNSVDLDRERAAFADNAVRYEATLRFINGNVRTLMSAITGQ